MHGNSLLLLEFAILVCRFLGTGIKQIVYKARSRNLFYTFYNEINKHNNFTGGALKYFVWEYKFFIGYVERNEILLISEKFNIFIPWFVAKWF